MTLTPRENKCLVFIRAHFAAHGVAPSYREIGSACGVKSTSNVAYIVDTLSCHKLLKRVGSARRVELLQTEDYHTHDCECDRCARNRYLADLKLVQAIQVGPEVALAKKLVGLRPLNHLERVDWRYRDKSRVRRKLLLTDPKASQTGRRQIMGGAV